MQYKHCPGCGTPVGISQGVIPKTDGSIECRTCKQHFPPLQEEQLKNLWVQCSLLRACIIELLREKDPERLRKKIEPMRDKLIELEMTFYQGA